MSKDSDEFQVGEATIKVRRLTRIDRSDGFTEFRNWEGVPQAVILTNRLDDRFARARQAVREELVRQRDAPETYGELWFDDDNFRETIIDGRVDLEALILAILDAERRG